MTDNSNPISRVPPAPPPDMSPRVVELARTIDHLPPGTYEVTINKRPAPQPWGVVIEKRASVIIKEVGA